MSRQTRRTTSVADVSDASQMDPWKDDRCRDFLTLNTIQRLRSYHTEALLPVEPVNFLRARNLVLLPKATPDERTCEAEVGCAIDAARIVFFGPTAFVSSASQGRMTVSPHAGAHSGSRNSQRPSEDITRTPKLGPSSVDALIPHHLQQQPHAQPNHQHVVDMSEQNLGHSEGVTDGGDRRPNAFDLGATPLRQTPNLFHDALPTPSPRQPERRHSPSDATIDTDAHEHVHEQELEPAEGGVGTRSGAPAGDGAEVVRFSCAIVEALVTYYQSLLSRGVVLDRFNAKDLAFAWWVVGRNMDVAALNQHTGPMRRDALLILVRHFYYELLTEQRIKKELAAKESDDTNGTTSPHENADVVEEELSSSANVSNAFEKTERSNASRKRPRSRLDPTRTSPPAVSSRLRRQQKRNVPEKEQPVPHKEQEGVDVSKNDMDEKAGRLRLPSSDGTTAPATVTAIVNDSNHRTKTLPKAKDATTTDDSRQITPKLMPSDTEVKKEEAVSKSETDTASVTTAPEKAIRPPRGANMEEIWRPLRATRRRPPASEDSMDFATLTTERRVELQSLIVERIQRRMVDDPVYATLTSSFPPSQKKKKGGLRSGMHPTLLRLLRYHHVDENPMTPAAMKESMLVKSEEMEETHLKKEEEKGNDGNENGRKEGDVVQSTAPVKLQLSQGQMIDWDAYMKQVAERMAAAAHAATVAIKSRHHNGEKSRNGSHTHCSNDTEADVDEGVVSCGRNPNINDNDNDNGVEDDENEEEEEEESEEDDEEDEEEFDPHAPLVRPPCSFSALTYAQQCLLAWEASMLLDPSRPVSSRKKRKKTDENDEPPRSLENGADVKPESGQQRRAYYDYWRSP